MQCKSLASAIATKANGSRKETWLAMSTRKPLTHTRVLDAAMTLVDREGLQSLSMRRLGKEAYLFNYNNEGHGLRKRQNQRDWTRRMQQFFDHYLMGAPAPVWLEQGVPAVRQDLTQVGLVRGNHRQGGGHVLMELER